MDSFKKTTAVASIALMAMLGMAGCAKNAAPSATETAKADTNTSAPADNSSSTEDKAAGGEDDGAASLYDKRPEQCQNKEHPGGEADAGIFTMELNFFQPANAIDGPTGGMKMRSYADSQMHFELDVKTTKYATNWGYSADETPANLELVYEIMAPDGKVIDKGMMMEMNAIDGSHYGTNLKNGTIAAPGDYKVKVTIYGPKSYAIHQDYLTGVPASGWWKPLTTTIDWKVTQQDLDEIAKAKVADPNTVPADCAKFPPQTLKDEKAEKARSAAEAEQPVAMPENMDH